MPFPRFIGLAGGLAYCFAATAGLAQTVRDYDVVALQGDPAPSAGPAATYGIIGVAPRIGPGGHITFGGFVGNNGGGNYAIWTGLPGEIAALAVKGDPTPGRTGETLDIFDTSSAVDYWPCADGSVAFRTTSDPPNDGGIWHGTPGNLREVAIVNSPVPGVAGATVKNFPGLVFTANEAGEVLVRATMQGAGITNSNDTILWVSKPDSIAPVAREGAAAPGGLGAAATFQDLTFLPLSINANGDVCFKAGIENSDIGTNAAIFSGPPDALMPTIRKGSAIPTLPGFEWDALRKPRINNAGETVFEAVPKAGGNKSFFVRSENGDLTRICEEDTPAAGAGAVEWKGLFFSEPAMGGNDYAAFQAGLGEDSNFATDGVWLAKAGTTSLVAKKGDPATGLPGQSFATFGAPCVNALGMVVFTATTDLSTIGLWFYHAGTLRLLLAVGDFLEVDADPPRRVAALSIKAGSGGQSGRPSSLNDLGQLVVRTSYNTGALGTGIHLINLCDLDGGSTDCLLELAFGGDPDSSADDLAVLPTGGREGDNLVLTFLRRTDGSFGYEVQSSTGPGGWGGAAGTLAPASDQSGVPAGFQRMEFRTPVTAGGSLMLRIAVTPG